MIHVSRERSPPAINVYTKATVKSADGKTKMTRAEKEREMAIVFFTNLAHYRNDQKITKKKFNFLIYKDPKLVEKLEEVFHGKCAYCESRFAHVTPRDIEHFRPKSEIDTGAGKVKPGYYWLAGEWENLLVACPDCNRSRWHTVPGQSNKVKLGKATQFPLDDETKRIRSHGHDLISEELVRLLLSPCVDDPREHLVFDQKGLVHPKDVCGRPSKMGRFSIDAYALQRKGLVEERLRVLNDMRFQFELLRHLVMMQNAFAADPGAEAPMLKNDEQIRSIRVKVESLLDIKAPYRAMLCDWVRLTKKAGGFNDLIAFGIDPGLLLQPPE